MRRSGLPHKFKNYLANMVRIEPSSVLLGIIQIECYQTTNTMNLDPDSQPLEIDWERLSQISDDDREFQLELLEMLATDMTEQLVLIKSAIELQDNQQLQAIGHYLKGATANVGVNSMTLIARQLEASGQSQDFTFAVNCLTELVAQQQKLSAYLATKTE
jgi:HPt (histidine-containing phosphotransfer) domain-containing protein